MEYRNPNEAMRYLSKVRKAMDDIIGYSSSTITTASASRGKVKVINLQSLPPSGSSSSPSKITTKKLGIKNHQAIRLKRTPTFEAGVFQNITKDSRTYRQTFALYQDLRHKKVEWTSLWSDNPHLTKLQAELENTLDSVREALVTLRRGLNKTTKDYCPTQLLNMVTDIELKLKEFRYGEFYSNREISFPDEEDANVVLFKFKYKFEDLKTHNNRVIPTYLVNVSFLVNIRESSAHGYLSTAMEFDPNHDLGGSFTTVDQAIDLLNTYLDLDRIDLDVVGVLPFPEIPGLSKESLESEWVDTLDIDPDTKRLYVRTKKFLGEEEQEDLLYSIMRHIPEHLRVGQLRVDVGVEAFIRVAPISDRNKRTEVLNTLMETFHDIQLVSIKPDLSSPLDFYIKTISFRVANTKVPRLKRAVSQCGVRPVEFGVRNVLSFAIGAGKRSDVRALRRFIDSISEEFDAETVLKVRRVLGV